MFFWLIFKIKLRNRVVNSISFIRIEDISLFYDDRKVGSVCVIMVIWIFCVNKLWDVLGKGVWVLLKKVGSFGVDVGEKNFYLRSIVFLLEKDILVCILIVWIDYCFIFMWLRVSSLKDINLFY